MKKILIFIFAFIISVQFCCAKDYTLNFNGYKYHLLYSIKNKDFGGYLNEYYKQGETYNIWSDMVAIHHFPNAYSPIDRIKDFKDYLSSMNIPSSLTFDDKKNAAMIDFIMITSDKMPVVLEFNIFKYEKSKKCGSIAVQYVKRYSATTTMQVEQIKSDFEKNRKTLLKKVKAFNIPQIVTEDIDKCISGVGVNNRDDAVNINNNENNNMDNVNDDVVKNNENSVNDGIAETSEIEVNTEVEKFSITDNKENKLENNFSPESDKSEDINNEENIVKTETNKSVNENSNQNSETILQDNKVDPSIQLIDDFKQENNTENCNIKKKNRKKIKEVNYIITNDKDSFYAKPRTKKELKKLKKQNKKNLKIKNTAYVITNDKNELIASPRTKKEMKKYKKLKAKQQKKNKKHK